MAEKSGDVRECALAGPRRARGGRISQGGSTAQREKRGTHGAMAQRLANRACEVEREEKRGGEQTDADRSALVGREQERERERGRESYR
jgi:hypothetical protein